jgi:hypothetical protein
MERSTVSLPFVHVQVPAIKMFVMVDEELDVELKEGEIVRTEERSYCNVEANLGEWLCGDHDNTVLDTGHTTSKAACCSQ